MRILVTGPTGFVGRALVPRLQADGHSIVAWARSRERARGLLGANVDVVDAGAGRAGLREAVPACDAIVNLAGEPIFGRRWTAARRRQLEDSRLGVTKSLVDAMSASTAKPRVLVSASAVGFYGNRGDEVLTETSSRGAGFLADLCANWEAAALKAEPLGARVVRLRISVVLGRGGGALAQMLPPFRFGLGGPIGSGRQYFPWIHRNDLVAVIAAALVDELYRGAVNAVAPESVTSGGFARALGRALHRPAVLPVPALALKMIFGDAASVLLDSQHAVPQELSSRGFRWEFPTLDGALAEIVRNRQA